MDKNGIAKQKKCCIVFKVGFWS